MGFGVEVKEVHCHYKHAAIVFDVAWAAIFLWNFYTGGLAGAISIATSPIMIALLIGMFFCRWRVKKAEKATCRDNK